jgi:acetate kinase
MAVPTVLAVNVGSSSLKLHHVGSRDVVLAERTVSKTDEPDSALADFLAEFGDPGAIGHRIVHGGSEFTEPVVLDEATEARLERLTELAPLHNPPALAAVRAAMRLRPAVPNVGCFDTAFHATLPAEAATYAIPESWAHRWELRRFGFHGLSHAYAARRAAALLERPLDVLRLITAHLGAGASLAAIDGGRSVDTTMGFTPLDGLVMATRSGSVDPGLLLWVQRQDGLDAASVEQALEARAGLLGLSGRSGDMREILAGVEAGDQRCRLAFDVYAHRLAGSVAAMAISLGAIDALVFTGGVGENQSAVRGEACRRLRSLGLALDPKLNERAGGDALISEADADAAVLVVTAREELEIAAATRAALSRTERRNL